MTSSVKRMLEMKSIDVEARHGGREDGRTCLTTTVWYGQLDICRLLIDKGADIEAKDREGWTPLHWAAQRGHIEVVRLLCDHGADIEAVNFYGRRPLPMAAMSGQISIVKELFEARNAEINARDDDGRTALWYARVNGYADVADYLVSHGGIE
jgi:ankyrin repeat protein